MTHPVIRKCRVIASFALAGTVMLGIVPAPLDMHLVGALVGTLLGIILVINEEKKRLG